MDLLKVRTENATFSSDSETQTSNPRIATQGFLPIELLGPQKLPTGIITNDLG